MIRALLHRELAQVDVLSTRLCLALCPQRVTGVCSTTCGLTPILSRFPDSFLSSADARQQLLLLCTGCLGVHRQSRGKGLSCAVILMYRRDCARKYEPNSGYTLNNDALIGTHASNVGSSMCVLNSKGDR